MKSIKYFMFILLSVSVLALYGCGDSKQEEAMEERTEMQEEMTENTYQDNTEVDIVRQGTINVKEIDENGDGKVYQCPMDWNVISDEEAGCPECGMDLVEVTIDEAKKNLVDNGFTVE